MSRCTKELKEQLKKIELRGTHIIIQTPDIQPIVLLKTFCFIR